MKHNWLIRAMTLCLAFCLCFAMTACGKDPVDNPSSDDTSGISSDVSDVDSTTPGDVDSDATSSTDDAASTGTSTGTGTSTTGGAGTTKTAPKKTNQKTTVTGVQSSGGGIGADTGDKLANDKVVDMGGYKFTILSPLLPTKPSKNSTLFEENFFARIDEVEEQYNCKVTILNSPYPNMETIKTYIVAGKKVADLIELAPYQMVAAKELGYIVPWDSQKIIDVKDPRWCDSYTKLGFYDGNQYGLQFTRPEEVRFCIVFNKTLLKANGINPDSLYDMVDKGTWTFDKFAEICTKVTKDTNSDGKVDQYGFCGMPNYISWGFIGANGAKMTKESGGKVVANFMDNKIVTALNFYDDLVNTKKVMFTNDAATTADPWSTVSAVDSIGHFIKGNTAFLLHESWVLNQQIKPRANFDYGMLPYPKGPDASGYVSDSNNARLMCLTATNKSPDKTATIFNAIARPVDDQLDWGADVQADYFQKNDTKSLKMYDLCLRNAMFDPARAVNELESELNWVFASTIFGRATTPAAALGAIGNKIDASIDALFNQK